VTIRVVSTDPLTGSRVLFQPGSDGDSFTLIDEQHVGGIVEQNKLLQNAGPHDRKSEMRRVASLPLNVWQNLQDEWKAKGLSYEDRQKAMRRFLMDPDNAAFRTDQTRFYR
jgi:hypothetical protein